MENYRRLTSSQPVTDCGRKYNIIYVVCALLGGIICVIIASNKISGAIIGVLFGLLIGWILKNTICRFPCLKLRDEKFALDNRVPYEELITRLNQTLTPMGMHIEASNDGSPSITFKRMIYDVRYDEKQNFFTIWWRKSIAGALLTTKEYIVTYRKVSVAMGLIGYYVQQACKMKRDDESVSDEINYNSKQQENSIGFCTQCGSPYKIGVAFCSKCGARIDHDDNSYSKFINEPSSNNKENKKKVGIILGCMALIIAVITAVIFLTGSGGENKKEYDLADYIDYSEDRVIKELGYEKNEYGLYPSENEMNIYCTEGKVWFVSLSSVNKNNDNKSIKGLKIGERFDEKNNKMNEYKLETSYETSMPKGIQRIYTELSTGYSLIIDTDYDNNIISLMYTPENNQQEAQSDEYIEKDDEDVKTKDDSVIYDNISKKSFVDISHYSGSYEGTILLDYADGANDHDRNIKMDFYLNNQDENDNCGYVQFTDGSEDMVLHLYKKELSGSKKEYDFILLGYGDTDLYYGFYGETDITFLII